MIKNSEKISQDFLELVKRLEFNYNEEVLRIITPENIQMIKEIIYVLYCIKKDNLPEILNKIKRQEIIELYKTCKTFQTEDFLSYYKQAIINKYM